MRYIRRYSRRNVKWYEHGFEAKSNDPPFLTRVKVRCMLLWGMKKEWYAGLSLKKEGNETLRSGQNNAYYAQKLTLPL